MGRRRDLLFSAFLAALAGCSHPPAGTAEAGAPSDVERAQALLATTARLPNRPETLSLAQSLEAAAQREGAGARAVELHALAAALDERLWRVEQRPEDAHAAIESYRAAGKNLALVGACDAAARAAKLAGEVAHDAAVTYSELYRVQRRSTPKEGGKSTCGPLVDDPVSALSAFRPPPTVIAAIDHGLAAEGAIPPPAASAPKAPPRVVRIEPWTGPLAARVVVHLDAPAPFTVGDLATSRTYVDLAGVDPGQLPREIALGGLVPRVSVEASAGGTRIVLDVDGTGFRRVYQLLEPYRIVIDISRDNPQAAPHGPTRAVQRIAIDAGHGGSEPGAVGPSGLREKDVTLAIAHRIAPVLARAGLEVTLTRDDDRTVTLEERTARANAFGADLFVSIHCNAAESHAHHGIETYVLDTTTSDMEGKVAARENATSQAASNEVAHLLASMRLADQATRSTHFAGLLQRAAIASLSPTYRDIADGGIHRAGFYVLVGARMPAVLFETSYISNAIEEERLGSSDYQQRLADAVANAVKAYKEGR